MEAQPLPFGDDTNAHYVALRLLGADEARLRPPRSALTQGDKLLGMALAFNEQMPLLYVESVGCCYRPTVPHLYERVEDYQLKRWMKAFWMRHMGLLGSLTPKLIRDGVDTIKETTKEYQEDLNRRYIYVGEQLFWDLELASFTDAPELPAFFKLFDTPKENRHFIRISPFTEAQVETLKQAYTTSLDYLQQHDGDLPEDFEFMTLWANYNHGVYMDLMRAAASPFMRRKPFGAFMAVGLKRNGKTAFTNDFMKTMLGTANCSSVQLAELGDYHKNHGLQWTLWNAPDEEDEKPTQFATIFKTIADHGEIKVTKLYSEQPLTIDCDFMCAFPMNHHPVWTGSGAAACVARSLIIEFTHQFEEDHNPESFAKRTFTADLFARILGPILALATYYRDRPLYFSDTMVRQQHELEGEMDSHTIYYDHFIAFFDGFQSINQIYDDYQIWCGAHDLPVASKPAFKLAFGPFTATGRGNLKFNGRAVKGFRVKQPQKLPLIEGYRYEVGELVDLHTRAAPLSIVERYEAWVSEQFGERAEEQMKNMVAVARRNMAARPQTEKVEKKEQTELSIDGGLFDERKGD